MSDQQLAKRAVTVSQLLSNDEIKSRFHEILGKRSAVFTSSIINIVNSSKSLQRCRPMPVVMAAVTAATMDLPISKELGYAWIVPYGDSAQFQIGWRGYVQLALRTSFYNRINVVTVYENQFVSFDQMTEDLNADFTIEGEGDVVGYAAYFKLNNGFEKTVYWTKARVIVHATRYSKTYGKKNKRGHLIDSPWNRSEDFDDMGKKTVLKNTLSKFGILSIEMRTAVMADQSIQEEEGEYLYPDNPQTKETDENGNVIILVSNEEVAEKMKTAKSLDELTEVFEENRAQIQRDIHLVAVLGACKKKFESDE